MLLVIINHGTNQPVPFLLQTSRRKGQGPSSYFCWSEKDILQGMFWWSDLSRDYVPGSPLWTKYGINSSMVWAFVEPTLITPLLVSIFQQWHHFLLRLWQQSCCCDPEKPERVTATHRHPRHSSDSVTAHQTEVPGCGGLLTPQELPICHKNLQLFMWKHHVVTHVCVCNFHVRNNLI